MRALSVIAALLAAGCSLLTDFDRTYPGEPTPDMGLTQDEACAEGCDRVLDCAEELETRHNLVCDGLAFSERVQVFLGLCVEQCLQEKDVPTLTDCQPGAARGFETRYGDAWTDLCDARESLCTELCVETVGSTPLVNCLMGTGVRPPAPRACGEVCRAQDADLWLCLGEQRYLDPGGSQCDFFEACVDLFSLEP